MTFPAILLAVLQATSQQPLSLGSSTRVDTAIAPGSAHRYLVNLEAGGSANVVVRQIGVDLVVEVFDPGGTLLATVDSPNGRNGDEPVEIIAAAAGAYAIRVRPFGAEEPAGRYQLSVAALRDARATTAMLSARTQARDSATAWLGRRTTTDMAAKFDSVARRARVIGLGEATHGSREFGDMRVRLTKRAIEQSGYRIVAIEASAARFARLNEYVAGRGPTLAAERLDVGAMGWIGGRSMRALAAWLRTWNAAHPRDHVTLIGVDDQNFLDELPQLREFLGRAYGARTLAAWATIERELAVADSQTFVFGNSNVDTTVRRQLFELTAALRLDEPVLRRLFGDTTYDRAAGTLAIVARFADFNDGASGVVSHERDWYMAVNLLRALSSRRGAKAVFWAHNTHVAHRAGRTAVNGPSGSVLREALGCDYQSIAMAFGEGAFLAQVPDDAENRLATDSIPANIEESVEGVMGRVVSTTALAMWGCIDDTARVPSWLLRPQPMRWVGGLWRPGSNASDLNRATQLLRDHDGLVYIPRVTAEEAPRDRPVIPARPRR
jgi:erythromycin esterase